MDMEHMILFEDKDMIVCHKPSGLPVQCAQVGRQDMMSMLMNYLSEGQQGMPYLGLVHRLDQPVEGIIVFAKNKKAAADLSRQVTDGSMEKVYLAVCCEMEDADENEKSSGEGKEPATTERGKKKTVHHLTDYLKKDARTNTSSIVPQNTPGAKKSELDYQILGKFEENGRRYTLVQIHLLTGRHHQIRVQMAGHQMPLYGDRKYHAEWENCRLASCEQGESTQLALCAASLSFVHPSGKKKRMNFQVTPSAGVFQLKFSHAGE